MSFRSKRKEWIRVRRMNFIKRVIIYSLPISSILIIGIGFYMNDFSFSFVLERRFYFFVLIIGTSVIHERMIHCLNDWFLIKNNKLLSGSSS